MKVLVTGATGFIGQRLANRLTSEGHYCLCLARNQNKTKTILKGKNIEFIYGDIRNKIDLNAYKNKKDVVVHLAALMGQVGIGSSRSSPEAADSKTDPGTHHLIYFN